MPPSDVDIHLAVHSGSNCGDEATAKAREKVDEMRSKGDADSADTWLRIIVALGTFRRPPTDAQH